MIKKLIKNILFYAISIYGMSVYKIRPHRLILCYHRLCDKKSLPVEDNIFAANFLKIQDFKTQIRFLSQFADFVSLDDIIFKDLNDKRWKIAITFDDGYRDVIEFGLPILEEYKIPATIFLNTYFVEHPYSLPWQEMVLALLRHYNSRLKVEIFEKKILYDFQREDDKRKFMRDMIFWFKNLGSKNAAMLRERLESYIKDIGLINQCIKKDDIKKCLSAGLISFGGHSYTHVNLAKCTKEELEYEIIEERKRLCKITGQDIKWFAYPYGKKKYRNEEVIEHVKKAGYKGAFTVEGGYLSKKDLLYELPRIPINGNWNKLKFKSRVLAAGFFNE